MKYFAGLSVLLAATLLFVPYEVFGRGFGGGGGGRGGGGGFGGGGGRGGGGFGGGGGGMARPAGGGGGARPNFGGGGGMANHTPSFSHPAGGGSSRPNMGGGNRPEIGGGLDRPGAGGSGTRGGIGNRPEIGGGGNRGGIGNDIGNRGGIGNNNIGGRGGIGNNNIGNRGGIGNNTNIGNRTNIGHIGNNNFNNIHNNINIASNHPYNNNWHHGNWNGNWNYGHGYVNGWAHGYANGYNRGFWGGGWGGYWHGGWGGYWGRPWYAAPIAWGLGAWAVGSVMYNSGYGSYSNSYCDSGDGGAYDYSQPISVINQQPDAQAAVAATDPSAGVESPPPSPEVQEGTKHSDLARDAFKTGDYKTAKSEIDLAIKSLPSDAALHEFRALVFFAMKDYKNAAATLYAVLSAGPGWDWTTLSGMYASIATYTEQFRNLEVYVKENPEAPDGHFVLAYHYLTCNHTEPAEKQFAEVLRINPKDQLSAQLLKLLKGEKPDAPVIVADGGPTPQPPDTDDSPENSDIKAPADVDAAKLVGKWNATRPDGAKFTLNLAKDSKFTWGFSESGKKPQEFGGKYSMDGAILVLERGDGAQMPGLVTLASTGFNFKLYGGPPDDAGLDFKK